jgi:hypothetical protein
MNSEVFALLETLFDLSNDPLLYTITLSVCFTVSFGAAWIFFFQYCDGTSVYNPQPISTHNLSQQHQHHDILPDNRLIHWLARYIRRKDSPPDDDDDHHSLLIFT